MLRFVPVLISSLLSTACYIEGGGCSGPVCFFGSTDACDGRDHCSTDTSDRCPDADDIQTAATREINRIRSTPTRCGTVDYPAATGLLWSQELFQAADRHALDMASNNFISQIGSDGLGVSARVSGEATNLRQSVAGGFADTATLISEWLRTGDCATLVDIQASGFGLACRYDGDSTFGQYWTLVTGAVPL